MRQIVILTVSLIVGVVAKANNNPKEWFGPQYDDAIEYCIQNRDLINSSLLNCSLPTDMVMAVAFPEMLRYSLWRDLFETKALELLYVSKGKDVADFSIGWLQMKPSFAEQVELKVANNIALSKKYSLLFINTKTSYTAELIRKERVKRLQDFKWQLLYLSAFVDVNYKILTVNHIPNNQMIAYLAAAYNHGMDNDLQSLINFKNTKTFPYGYGRDNPFGYVEVSEYFYRNNATTLFTNL